MASCGQRGATEKKHSESHGARTGQVGRAELAQGRTGGQGQGDPGGGGWRGGNEEAEIRKGCQYHRGELESGFHSRKARGCYYTYHYSLSPVRLARAWCLKTLPHCLLQLSGYQTYFAMVKLSEQCRRHLLGSLSKLKPFSPVWKLHPSCPLLPVTEVGMVGHSYREHTGT